MADRTPPQTKDSARAAREKRLAEALRANLRRRKGPAANKTGGKGDAGSAENAPKTGDRER